jgi:hypothetical protein
MRPSSSSAARRVNVAGSPPRFALECGERHPRVDRGAFGVHDRSEVAGACAVVLVAGFVQPGQRELRGRPSWGIPKDAESRSRNAPSKSPRVRRISARS